MLPLIPFQILYELGSFFNHPTSLTEESLDMNFRSDYTTLVIRYGVKGRVISYAIIGARVQLILHSLIEEAAVGE